MDQDLEMNKIDRSENSAEMPAFRGRQGAAFLGATYCSVIKGLPQTPATSIAVEEGRQAW